MFLKKTQGSDEKEAQRPHMIFNLYDWLQW